MPLDFAHMVAHDKRKEVKDGGKQQETPKLLLAGAGALPFSHLFGKRALCPFVRSGIPHCQPMPGT